MFSSVIKCSYCVLLIFAVAKSQHVLKTIVRRSTSDETLNSDKSNSETEVKKKTDLSLEKVNVFGNVEDRFHCIDKTKKEYSQILENGLNCEAIETFYILKSNIYSCYDLYLPIWFYGFRLDVENPKNFTSILMEGFLPNGNGTDLIQKTQIKTENCIFYMK